jgi:phosphoribosylformimino-5-aminoimidazole carboxamide ribotide isomerase
MMIYPAIDLRGGKVVRLKEGDPERQTTFSDDPVATAEQWVEQGATWIHMINLDGAFSTANDNLDILERVARLNAKVQFGGGLRQAEDIQRAIDLGAARVVLGTVAVEQPAIIAQSVAKFGAERICIALDARDGRIATHGWQQVTELTPVDFGKEIARHGAIHALYTDVKRDGSLIGANVQGTIKLGRETGLRVIASGGVTSVDEIHQLARSRVVAGAIIGMALYQGKITLKETLMAARITDAG